MAGPTESGERLVEVENAALSLADAVEDLVRDMEAVVLDPTDSGEKANVQRARKLARVVRAAVANARRETPGSLST
jgi:hypothetical protein